MSSFKWLRRTSSFQQPDRRASRQFTPRVGEVEKRIAPGSLSGVAASFNANSASFNGSFNDGSSNNGNFN
jgi:hypothetical protein